MVESILTVGLEVVKCLAPPTERQISYLRNYKSNMENLKTEIGKLKNERESLKHAVDQAKRQGEEIEKNVEDWLRSANNVIEEAEKFVDDEAAARCLKGLCPNLKTRLRRSKEAVRLQDAVLKLLGDKAFPRISYRTVLEDTVLMPNKDDETFESRKTTLEKILGALKDPEVNMLGIYGMGGIGKTTLAKEAAGKAMSEKLFNQVVFVEVPQSQDQVRNVQGQIADKLGLSYTEESESGRARRLCDRLKKEEKILVILDNIWDKLDLQAVGVPHGDDPKGCKIMLTSRSEDTLLRQMGSKANIPVGFLEKEEAWSLFKKLAGDYIEGGQFKSVALDVASECAGLPVSIVSVARALQGKELMEWKDALQQLKSPNTENFKDAQPAYPAIELSYNKLQGRELKDIFLLIAYTYITSIDELLLYVIGLGLLQGVHGMEKARGRVYTLVRKLVASCLLLNEDLSIHDVVRDVAIHIASRDKNVYVADNDELVSRWEWSKESSVKVCTEMVLRNINTHVLPEVLDCPQLKLLRVTAPRSSSLQISENLFTRTAWIRVLGFTYGYLSLLPSSLGLLTNLRTLCLYGCPLEDLRVVGNLTKLEIFRLESQLINKLPVEVGLLTQLRSLDLRGCLNLEVIPPNVLSNLSHLEELYIVCFNNWEANVGGFKNASLDELKHLTNLTTLELHVKHVSTLPKGLFFEKLERFCIYIRKFWFGRVERCYTRTFILDLDSKICLQNALIVKLQGVEELWLYELQEQDVNYVIDELVKAGSSQLKDLYLRGSYSSYNKQESKNSRTIKGSNEIILEDEDDLSTALFYEKVAIQNLKKLELDCILHIQKIWPNQLVALSCGIQSLASLILTNCPNLKYPFSSSFVSHFVRLQLLEITWCPVLEELIVIENQELEERKKVIFPQLLSMKIQNLKKLKSFCTGDVHVVFPSLEKLRLRNCPELTSDYLRRQASFPNLKELRVQHKDVVPNCLFSEDVLCKIELVNVEIHDKSTTILYLDDLLQRFYNIKLLQLTQASSDDILLGYVGSGTRVIVQGILNCHLEHILKQGWSSILLNLEVLDVRYCFSLNNVLPSSTSFQNLTRLSVVSCNRLRNVLTSSTAKTLTRLRFMSIRSCNMVEEIVADDEEEGDKHKDNAAKNNIIVFSCLQSLELIWLGSLTSFCSGKCAFVFPSLETLVWQDCHKMTIFCGGELSTPKLQKVHVKRWWPDQGWSVWEHDLNTTIHQLCLK